VNERIIATTTHGRYLTVPPDTPEPAPILVGFHGYAENAETQLDRLRAIPGSDRWLVVSIQALHRFYRRGTNNVVASWMTRQDRENAIADNIAYVKKCVDEAATERPTLPVVVFAGFSQGVAMAFRAAVHIAQATVGVIALGGDIPPEIAPSALGKVSAALLVRGSSDELYSGKQFAADERRLLQSAVTVRAVTVMAGHDWPAELNEPASRFLRELSR
jgi:predicted esterase